MFFRLEMRTFFDVIYFPFMEGDGRSDFSGGWMISSPDRRGRDDFFP